MTIDVSNNNPRIEYAVTTAQSAFTIPFEFFDDGDILAYVGSTLKTITTHYTISGGGGSTGTLTFSPSISNATVVITRNIPLERVTDFTAGADINRAALNEQLDTLVAQIADVDDKASRTIQIPDYEVSAGVTLPAKDDRKGRLFAFNESTGAPEVGPTIANAQTLTAITADIATLADIEDGTVATNAIKDVAAIASNVTTVADISGNVTTVAGNNANVTTVAGISGNVTTVANDSSNIVIAATNIASINTNASNIGSINTVAAQISNNNLQTIATDIAAVISVANDLNEATSEIDVVANNIANVNIVGTDIANVNTVATNIADVNNFADTYAIGATSPAGPTVGDLWFDTSAQAMKVYGSSGWQNAGSSVNGTAERVTYTATAAQTTFAATYDAGFVDVWLNGIKLTAATDFTATNGTSIVLAVGAGAGDLLDIVGYGTFELANFAIGDANNVSTSGITDGQVLAYNNATGIFEPSTLATVATTGAYADLTGTPTGLATETFVGTAIANLVDTAPATLDTLNELAAALGDDPNFATTVTNSIALKAPLASPAFTGGIDVTGTAVTDGVTVNGTLDIKEVRELVTIDNNVGSSSFGVDSQERAVVYLNANQTANRTLNFVNVNSLLSIGQSYTGVVLASQGGTAYYFNAYQVDGSAVTPKWQGGSAPTGGNANSIDSYSFTIIKTANATFTVLASQTQFA